MPYIDATYYNETYKGKSAADEPALAVFLDRASDIIDQLTHYQIATATGGLTSFSLFVQNQVKKATAAQAEFLIVGGDMAANTGQDGASNVSIGSFSYSKGAASGQAQNNARSAARTSPAVIEYLKPTGLLFAGIEAQTGVWNQ